MHLALLARTALTEQDEIESLAGNAASAQHCMMKELSNTSGYVVRIQDGYYKIKPFKIQQYKERCEKLM